MTNKALADKVFIMGIDGMDAKLTRKYLQLGKMPNLEKFLTKASCREDLVLLGGLPAITPPMWTTLATGCSPLIHGITSYFKQSKTRLDALEYNFSSLNCKAEPLWNVLAEAGKKTLVFHWPGSSWPPTSDSENLNVVDGTSPAGVNMATGQVEAEFMLIASSKTENVMYKQKAACDANIPCTVTDLEKSTDVETGNEVVHQGDVVTIILDMLDGEGGTSDAPFDVVLSPIKNASGWANNPENAKELTMLLSGGFLRRPCLILANEQGIYDKLAIYKSKKESAPIAVITKNEFKVGVIDESIKNDITYIVNRNMRLLEIAEDGSYVKLWVSAAMNTKEDSVWHPQRLYTEVTKNVGFPPPTCLLGGSDRQLIEDCMLANWYSAADWHSGALNHLMETGDYQVVFSHFHNVDMQFHMFLHYAGKGSSKLPKEAFDQFVENVYVQTDYYIGKYLHLLDEGWTVLIVSDHGLVSSIHEPEFLGDNIGVSVRIMQELGFTNVKHDEDGNELHEIDWEHTKAIATRGNNIYINLKGRDAHGIVDPKDKYQLEEDIITALYGYKSKQTGERIVAMALRNKDAIILGCGGDEFGDIIFWTAEGYNYHHGDSLSTCEGLADSSINPVFIATGPGILPHVRTNRYIRSIDIAPTVAVLAGVKMPRDCEGAPVYQILAN